LTREYRDSVAKNRYSAKNLIAPVVVLVAVVQPEVIAVYGAYNTGVHVGNTFTGRDSGADVPSIVRGDFANARVLTPEQRAAEAKASVYGIADMALVVVGAAGTAARNADEGVAIVRYYKNADGSPHWTVETMVPGQPNLHTHQVVTSPTGRSTQIEVATTAELKSKNLVATHREPLPRADRARAVQQDQLQRGDTGPFARTGPKANSCATAVGEVVNAGGGKAPWKPQDAASFLRALFNLFPIK
jgi:hypothetical protein